MSILNQTSVNPQDQSVNSHQTVYISQNVHTFGVRPLTDAEVRLNAAYTQMQAAIASGDVHQLTGWAKLVAMRWDVVDRENGASEIEARA
jgi:hypothetical protein